MFIIIIKFYHEGLLKVLSFYLNYFHHLKKVQYIIDYPVYCIKLFFKSLG